MHAIVVFEDVRRVTAVLPSASRYDAIVGAVVTPEAIEQPQQLLLALLPVGLLLAFGHPARVAHAVLVEAQAAVAMALCVSEFDRRGRTLVRHHAAPAKQHLLRQAVAGFQLLGHPTSPRDTGRSTGRDCDRCEGPAGRCARGGTERPRHSRAGWSTRTQPRHTA